LRAAWVGCVVTTDRATELAEEAFQEALREGDSDKDEDARGKRARVEGGEGAVDSGQHAAPS
jgi:hypothetical protein